MDFVDTLKGRAFKQPPEAKRLLRKAAKEIERLRAALEIMTQLHPTTTMRDVFDAGDKAIEAFGLNPWCLNEGRASEDDEVDTSRLLHP